MSLKLIKRKKSKQINWERRSIPLDVSHTKQVPCFVTVKMRLERSHRLHTRTTTNRPQTAWSAFDRHVQGSCYLIQSHCGSIVPIHAVARCMANPNVGQRFYGNGVTVVNVVKNDVGTRPYICKQISTRTEPNL